MTQLEAFGGAKWIAAEPEFIKCAPLFRKDFELASVKSAKIRIIGLGTFVAYLNGKRIKIITAKARACEHDKSLGALVFDKNSLSVACADGFVDIIQLQPEGKSVQQVKDFLNGNKLLPDMAFERNID